jgi:hypothetical protein
MDMNNILDNVITLFVGLALLGTVLASCCKNNIWSKCPIVI